MCFRYVPEGYVFPVCARGLCASGMCPGGMCFRYVLPVCVRGVCVSIMCAGGGYVFPVCVRGYVFPVCVRGMCFRYVRGYVFPSTLKVATFSPPPPYLGQIQFYAYIYHSGYRKAMWIRRKYARIFVNSLKQFSIECALDLYTKIKGYEPKGYFFRTQFKKARKVWHQSPRILYFLSRFLFIFAEICQN